MFTSLDTLENLSELHFSSTTNLPFNTNSTHLLLGTVEELYSSSSYSLPKVEIVSEGGVFVVGKTGEVSFDYLFDGGKGEGELAIFNLDGLDQYGIGSEKYIQEAAWRALQNSPDWGYVVISDPLEGAKFSGIVAGEDDSNVGNYQSSKTFLMHPETQFGIMLVPNTTVFDALSYSDTNGSERPLFSIPLANHQEVIQFAQVVKLGADSQRQVQGSTFSFEDEPIYKNSDRDYNDLIFQLKGATGKAPLLEEVMEPQKDWRNSLPGQEIMQFAVDPLDWAGNTIDKARGVVVSSDGKNYQGWVGSIDTVDYFSFSLGVSNSFSLKLDSAIADVNVELFDIHGDLVHSATSSNTELEFHTILDGGAYYLRVTPINDGGTPYNIETSVMPLIDGITTTGSEVPIFTNTNVSSQLINLNTARSGPFSGINGTGWASVIIDNGINLNHPFFGSDSNGDGVSDRIVFNFDFADNDTDASSTNAHGTNVSSIVASQDPTFTGIAPGASIIHLKVFPNSGNGNFAYTEQALQWVINNVGRYNIASVNMSLGDNSNLTVPQSRYGLGDELQRLADLNVIVVSASGNSFAQFDSTQGVSYPAADPNSLSIGAVFDSNIGSVAFASGATAFTTGADRITPFSQRSQTLTTVFAPGSPITGAGLGDDPGSSNYLSTQSGTSQAAPHISGIAVLAQQLAAQEIGRRLTLSEFRNLLVSTGVTVNDGDDEDDNVINTGLNFQRVDVLALGQAIANL